MFSIFTKYVRMVDVIFFTIVLSVTGVTLNSAIDNEQRKATQRGWDKLLASQVHHTEALEGPNAVDIATQSVMTRIQGGRTIHIPNLKKALSNKQTYLLTYAYYTAKKDKIRPEVLQGILWQESKAGDYPGHKVAGHEFGLKPMQRYYGVAQIKLSAARDVLKAYPGEFKKFDTDEELIANLILNDKFNVKIASKYLRIIARSVQASSKNYRIAAYNRGATGAQKVDVDNFHYTVAVNKHIKQIMNIFNYEIHAFTRTDNKSHST